jgi:exodeoxyribonuclease III
VAMKIATFNINNVNERLPNLLAWLRAARPNVVCLTSLSLTTNVCARSRLHGLSKVHQSLRQSGRHSFT